MAWRLLAVLLGLLAASARAETPAAGGDPFEKTVGNILTRRCLGCHNASEAKGELVLTTREGLQKGGESGPVVVAGKPQESSLYKKISAGEMPPPDGDQPQTLPPDEIAAIRAWVLDGANWPEQVTLNPLAVTTSKRAGLDWWSLQPIRRVAIPAAFGNNFVDSFIHHQQAAANLEPAPPADRRTLIRRLYYDLTGLPPALAAVQAFIAAESPDAAERLGDELLAAPDFGERWGRYWLDLVRYADTNGYERDAPKPNAWRYRDYVIAAFNHDKPYDRFVREQLAGDEIAERSEQTVVATGLLRVGTWDDEPNDELEYKYERLEDLVHVTGTAFLGLTVKCARCHDHKFDPIPQTDYYRLAAAFWAGPIEPRGRELMGGPTQDELGFDLLGWTDRGREVPPLMLLKKGDPHRPVAETKPATLSFVAALAHPLNPPAAAAKTSGRRLQFAQWLLAPQHPLTARVLVNRLWQHHFGEGLVRSVNNFGFKGDAPTDLELLDYLAAELHSGEWRLKRLHRRLINSQTYRQASIHPRQEEYTRRDIANQRWWRANRRRLDAEALRDTLLAVSGQLQRPMGGPGFLAAVSSGALDGLSTKAAAWNPSPPAQQARRSVYAFSKRSLLLPLLTTFDFCDTTQPCGQRDVNVVAPQALALLNSDFSHQASVQLAERVWNGEGQSPDRAEQARRVWRIVLARDPTDEEITAAVEHLALQCENFQARPVTAATAERLALASLCHVLLNTNELIYVD